MQKRKNIGSILPISVLSLFAVFLTASFLFFASFDYADAFDFTISNGGDRSVIQGGTVTNGITIIKTQETATEITLTVSGLPSGVTAVFDNNKCTPNPTCVRILTLSASPSAPPVTNATITVTGTYNYSYYTVSKTTTFKLTVNALPVVNGSCGTNANTVATAYESTVTGYSGTFCSVGTASPANPVFPAQGSSTSWSCNGLNGGSNASCIAYRKPATPNLAGTPTTVVAGTDVTFFWGAIANATYYRIYYYKNGSWDLTGIVVTGTYSTVSTTGLSNVISAQLSACTANNICSEKSAIASVTINQPAVINGSCGTNTNTVATAYESTKTSYTGTFCSAGTVDPSSPAFPAPYTFLSTWHCLGSNGGTSAYCTAYKKTETPVLTVSPSPVAPGGNVTFSWNSVPYAMSYLIYYYKNGVWDGTNEWVSGVTSKTVSTAGLTSFGAVVYSYSVYAVPSNPSNQVFVSFQQFDFTLSNSESKSVIKGNSVTNAITVTKSAGTAAAVALTASGMPAGVTATLSPTSCTPNSTCTSTITLNASSSAATGNYTITVSGTSGSISRTTSFTLTISAPSPVNGSCGTNANTQATAYESTVTSYSGTFCSAGTASPSSPIFPSPNLFLSTWNCLGLNGGTNAYCTAYRKPTTPVLSVSPPTVILNSGSNVTFSWTYDQYAMSYLIYYYKNGVWDSIGTWVSGTSATVSTAGLTSLGAKVYSYDVYIPSNPSNQVFVTFDRPFDFGLSNPGAVSITAGGSSVTNAITVTKTSGTAAAVTFSASGLPTGITASFSPTSCIPNSTCNSNIILSASSSTAEGNYTITVSGSNGSTTRYTYFTLNVSVPFRYSIASEGFKSVPQGGSSVSNAITVTKISGTASAVALYASGGPSSGLTMSFSPGSCTPNNSCASTLTLSASSSAAAGNYTITVSGSPSGVTTSFTLNIYAPVGPVINGSCGTNTNTAATAYETTKASYSGTFCSSGTVNPSSPAFPLPGGSVAWNCVGSGGGSTASCAAYKKTETPTIAFTPATVIGGENVTFYWTAIPYATAYVIDYYKNGNWERYTTTLAYSVVSTAGLTSLSAVVYSCGVATCSNPSYQSSVPIQQFDFSLSNTGSRSVVKGASVLNTITVTRTLGSISKTISLSASGMPQGVTATLSPTSCIPNGSCTSTLTLSASASAVAGNYTITVNGSDGISTKNTSFTLSVVDPFNYSLTNEGSKAVNRGNSTSNTITVTKTAGIGATVSLTYGVLPSGVTASFSPTSCVPGNTCTSSMLLNVDSSAALGTYTITVTGTSGSVSKTTSFSLVVATVSTPVSFDYSLSNGGDRSIIKGNQTTNTITATKISGTAASIGFLVSGLPTGVIASFSPTSCIPDSTCSSTLNLASSLSSPAGTYPITVTGTSGSVSRTTSFTLTLTEPNVFDFGLSNAGSKIIYLGSYATNGIYVTKNYGTVSPVAFTSAITPSGSGLSATSSPASCTPDATCSSSFILTSSASTVPGNYTVTVTGTSGSTSRTTSFSLIIWSTPAASCPLTDVDGTVVPITNDVRLIRTGTVNPGITAFYIDVPVDSSKFPAGLYTVKTYSWDNYTGRSEYQPNEQWYLRAYNGVNLLGALVDPTTDLLDVGFAEVTNTFFEGLNIEQSATKIQAIHKCQVNWDSSCQSDISASSVVPICAAFKKSDAQFLTVDQVTTDPISPILKNTKVDVSAYISTNIENQTSNFTYYCNSTNNDAVLSPGWDGKHDGVSANKFDDTFADLCNYVSPGQYYPKVVVERGGKIAAGRILVDVISEIPEDENWPPSATNLTAVEPSNYCVSPLVWSLMWAFSDPDGDSQSAYQIVIRDTSNGSLVKDTGKITSSSNAYAIPSGTLNFNKTYSWSVTVWDSNQNSLSSTANGPDFTTMKHAPPALSADLSPNKISLNEILTITDTTTVYGGSTKSAWDWNFSNVTGYTLITEPPLLDEIQVKFTTLGPKNIILRVTDSDGYWCERGFNYSSTDDLPDINLGRSPSNFREVVP